MRSATENWSMRGSNGRFVGSKPLDESRSVGRGVRRLNLQFADNPAGDHEYRLKLQDGARASLFPARRHERCGIAPPRSTACR